MANALILAGLAINLAGVIGGWLSLRGRQRDQAVKIQEIHILVNSQLDAALARGLQLSDALEAAQVEVPPAPSAG